MKVFTNKFLMVASATMIFAGISSAATVVSVCTPIAGTLFALGTTPSPQTSICSGLGALGAGNTLTGVSLGYEADFTLGTPGTTNTVLLSFTPNTLPAGVTFNLGTTTLTVTGVGNSPGFVAGTATGVGYLADGSNATGFNVSIASAVTAGGVNGSSGRATVTYTYTVVPEPASFALIDDP